MSFSSPGISGESSAKIAGRIWGLDPDASTGTRFGVSDDHLSTPARFPPVRVETDLRETTSSRRVRLLSAADDVVRQHDDADLMREFFPLRLHLRAKGYAIVPIYAEWGRALLNGATDTSVSVPTSLKLRVDNVYYCYPKLSRLTAGDLVVFYEPASRGGSGSAIGCAVIRETVIDAPENLFARFSDLGVYRLDDVRQHSLRGRAMAIHFELFEPFERPVSLAEIRKILNNRTNIQGLTKITRDQFERVRERGLS
jgi:hypothetical protein